MGKQPCAKIPNLYPKWISKRTRLLFYSLLATGFHLFQGSDYLFFGKMRCFHFEIFLGDMLLENLYTQLALNFGRLSQGIQCDSFIGLSDCYRRLLTNDKNSCTCVFRF